MTPHSQYVQRLEDRLGQFKKSEWVHINIGRGEIVTVAAVLIVAALKDLSQLISGYWLLVPIAAFAALAVWHERTLRVRNRAQAAVAFYQKGLARLEDRWAGTGDLGDRFLQAQHPYAADLDIFGRGSLFSSCRSRALRGARSAWPSGCCQRRRLATFASASRWWPSCATMWTCASNVRSSATNSDRASRRIC